MIDSNIVVTILEVNGDNVRVGIDAPKDIPIHRLRSRAERDSSKDTDKKLS